MYNKVIMVGNLTRDIELKYLPSGALLLLEVLLQLHTNIKHKMEAKKRKYAFWSLIFLAE